MAPAPTPPCSNHPTYGDATAAIDIDAGPVTAVVNAASTDSNVPMPTNPQLASTPKAAAN